nr:reverse transcriptase domain-containing protein [Tanacetum cinerariifolium]
MVQTTRQNPTLEPSSEPNPDIAAIITQQLQNILPQIVSQVTANMNNANGGDGNGGNNGCSYKTFIACNPKEFDGKGGVVALTRWIENMESVFDNCGCITNQRVRYATSCFVNKALTWWNTQVQARGKEAAIGITWNDFKVLLVEEFCLSNEIEKLENEFWNHTMVGANHVAYTDRFHELAKLVPYLVTLESSRIKRTLTKGNDKRKEMEESSKKGSTWKDNKKAKTGSGFAVTVPPKNDNVNTYPSAKCYTFHSDNAPSIGQARNPLALEGNKNTRNNGSQARGKAFNGNAVEALQDPKVVTEIADGESVEVDRVIRDCKLELGNSLFAIDLISLGHGSFDVIVRMDWLSKNTAVIVCHEKVFDGVIHLPFLDIFIISIGLLSKEADEELSDGESDPEEDPEEYEDDESEDGPVDYPIDGGYDVDDDDGNSSRDDADDEDEDEEEEEEHLAPADSAIVIPTVELVSPPEGTEPASITLSSEAEVERLLAMPTLPPSPFTSLSPPSTKERLARCTTPSTHSSPPHVPSPLPSPPLPSHLYIPPHVDRRDDIPETEMPPRKRLCLSTLESRYEVRESSTTRPTGGRGIDYGFFSTLDAEARRQGIGEVGYGIRDTWVDPTEAVPEIAPMT